MPAVTRLADQGTGHGCWVPRGNDEASPNVFVNNIPIHRATDHWPIHCCGPACHDSNLAEGDLTVTVNGKLIGRIGDAVACGSKVAQGSPNVFSNGPAGSVVNITKFAEPKKIVSNQYTLEGVANLFQVAGSAAPYDDHEEGEPKGLTLPPDVPPPNTQPFDAPVDDTADTKPPPNTEGKPTLCTDIRVKPQIDYNAKLTENFTVGDLSAGITVFPHSIIGQQVKERDGTIVDLLPEDIICNLQALAENILEPLSKQFPNMRINSGFRRNESGPIKSQHNKGQAVDLQWEEYKGKEYLYSTVAKWMRDNLPLDQLIMEHGNSIWLHVSYNRNSKKQRGQLLTMVVKEVNGKNKQVYEPGLYNYYAYDPFGKALSP